MSAAATSKLCLTCEPGNMIRSQTGGGVVANWIQEQGRLSAIPPNAPPPDHPPYNPEDATLSVSVTVGGPSRKMLWWGATPRSICEPPKHAGRAYGFYTNMGIAQVDDDGVLKFYAQAPQAYLEEGVLWPPHFHFAERDAAGWDTKVQTVAGYPGHSEIHKVKGLARVYAEKSSVLTPDQVRKHRASLIVVNALPMQYDNIDLPGAVHMHVPHNADPTEISKAANEIGIWPYVVYCEKPSCGAGVDLIAKLVQQGAVNVYYMPAGRQGWRPTGRRPSRRRASFLNG